MKTRYEAEKETKQMKDTRKFQQKSMNSKTFNKTWDVEYAGHKGIVTHRDPATGNLYCEF